MGPFYNKPKIGKTPKGYIIASPLFNFEFHGIHTTGAPEFATPKPTQGLVLALHHLRPQAELIAAGVRVERLAEPEVWLVQLEARDGEGDGLLVVADNAEVTLQGDKFSSELFHGVRGRVICGHVVFFLLNRQK